MEDKIFYYFFISMTYNMIMFMLILHRISIMEALMKGKEKP